MLLSCKLEKKRYTCNIDDILIEFWIKQGKKRILKWSESRLNNEKTILFEMSSSVFTAVTLASFPQTDLPLRHLSPSKQLIKECLK